MATSIYLPGHRRRAVASKLFRLHQASQSNVPASDPITVVCISDTHNRQPRVPQGDILLHAGDMTEWGSFEELQKQLSWLSSLPHKHKIIIAGNHDVLLDRDFMTQHPERVPWRVSGENVAEALDFGSCIYLNNTSAKLTLECGRTLTVYGSPTTPRSGISAFQAPRHQDTWTNRVPVGTDIILTHGPPYGHLDKFPPAGCVELLQEIQRVRPRLVVFGHIHVGYGRENVVFDGVRNDYEGIMGGWYGYEALLSLLLRLSWDKIVRVLRAIFMMPREEKVTTLVNAAVVGGPANELHNPAIVVAI